MNKRLPLRVTRSVQLHVHGFNMRLFNKDLIIERMEEDREDLEAALDDIEAYGERYEWCV